MSSEPQNFERLRELMALKRHEQPPPGYFDSFSGEVVARIRAGAQGARDMSDILAPAPWLLRLFNMLETKPFFAGAFGMGICALLISGIVYSEQVQPSPDVSIAAPVLGAASLASASSAEEPLTGRMEAPSADPTTLRAQSLFQQIQLKATSATSAAYPMPAGFGTNSLLLP